jgi:hypothetical protein
MAPTPIGATHRLDFQVSVPGAKPHHFRIYCNAQSSIADPSGFDVLDVIGHGFTGATDAVEQVYTIIKPLYATTVTIGGIVLEQYAGGAWAFKANVGSSGPGTNTGAYQIAQQMTYVFRTTGNKKAKLVLMETSFPYIGHTVDLAGTGVDVLVAQEFLNTAHGHVGSWAESRGAGPMAGFVSITLDSNDKIRRERGVS